MKLNYFNFKPFGNDILLTNDFGEYIFVNNEEFRQLISKAIEPGSEVEKKLLNSHMIYDETSLEFTNKNRYEMQYLKGHLNTSTSLHIFVVTTACNMGCVYCQANNGTNSSNIYMDKKTAEKAVDIALQSPTRCLTFEFQGGEPLLNFDIIKHIVEYTEEKNVKHNINYNVVTNITLIDDEKIEFFKKYNFGVSTSIDGHEILHNNNRPFKDGSPTFKKILASLEKIRNAGIYVGAIQTTTRESLKYPEEIVKTYYNLGFDSIFIRPLTPLGKATINWKNIGYTAEEYLEFYLKALKTAIALNKDGVFFKEEHATILLKRMFGHFVNYMELRSPCGAGIGQLAYYADGNIFTCDEGRMLYEMGNDAFKLGNVESSTYNTLIGNNSCKAICASSILESIPTCCDCVYQPYCGICPVVSYSTSGDIIEKSPRGYRCKIYSGMLDELFLLLKKNNPQIVHILQTWSN